LVRVDNGLVWLADSGLGYFSLEWNVVYFISVRQIIEELGKEGITRREIEDDWIWMAQLERRWKRKRDKLEWRRV